MIDKTKLQVIVERTAPRKNKDGSWQIDDRYVPEFIRAVNGYVTSAVKRSDPFDPEDTKSEVILQLWLALKRYGPRPHGFNFADYTLKLKVNNILTNRANRRKYINKHKANYHTVSLDHLSEVENTIGQSSRLPQVLLQEYSDNLSNYYAFDTKKTKKSWYNSHRHKQVKEKNMEVSMKLGDGDVGKMYLTKYDKKIQLLSRTEAGCRVLVLATGKEVDVPLGYMVAQVAQVAQVAEEKINTVKVESEKVMDEKIRVEASEVRVEASEVLASETPVVAMEATAEATAVAETETVEEVQKKKRVRHKLSAKQVVVDLLKSGEQTKDTLASAIMKQFPDRSDSLDKVKNYVGVILSNLRNHDGLSIVSPTKGTYLVK